MTTVVPPPASTEPSPDRRPAPAVGDRRQADDAFSPVLSQARSRLDPTSREQGSGDRSLAPAERADDPIADGQRRTVERRLDRHEQKRRTPDRSDDGRRADDDRRHADPSSGDRTETERSQSGGRSADPATSGDGADDRADADGSPEVESRDSGQVSTDEPANRAIEATGVEGAAQLSAPPPSEHPESSDPASEGATVGTGDGEVPGETATTATDPTSGAAGNQGIAAAGADSSALTASGETGSETTSATTPSGAATDGLLADGKPVTSPSAVPAAAAGADALAVDRLGDQATADELAGPAGPAGLDVTAGVDGSEAGRAAQRNPGAPADPTSAVPAIAAVDGPDADSATVQMAGTTGPTASGEADEVWAQVQRALNRIRPIVDGQELRLRLHPAELGELLVQVRARGEQLTVRLVASSPAAQQLLLSDQQRLTTELAAAGFDDGMVDISHRDPSGGGTGPGSDDRDGHGPRRPGNQAPAAFVDPTEAPTPSTTGRRLTTGRRAGLVDVTL